MKCVCQSSLIKFQQITDLYILLNSSPLINCRKVWNNEICLIYERQHNFLQTKMFFTWSPLIQKCRSKNGHCQILSAPLKSVLSLPLLYLKRLRFLPTKAMMRPYSRKYESCWNYEISDFNSRKIYPCRYVNSFSLLQTQMSPICSAISSQFLLFV